MRNLEIIKKLPAFEKKGSHTPFAPFTSGSFIIYLRWTSPKG